MPENRKIKQLLIILIGVSTLVRAFLAATLEFGNDEVYYYLYALYPDLSHFDHPPMVGLVIQLFTFNLKFDSEFFIRLASIIFGSVNTFLVFRIGRKIKDEQTGFYAALLYTSSIYAFVITGIFILPDTPQMLFWLLTMCITVEILAKKDISKAEEKKMLLAGALIGFGMLSKYTSVYLWVAIGSYIVFYNRVWFKKPSLYFSVLISAILFIPVIYWNVENSFISLGYQGGRMNLLGSGIRPDYFLMEILGEFFYKYDSTDIRRSQNITQALFAENPIEIDYRLGRCLSAMDDTAGACVNTDLRPHADLVMYPSIYEGFGNALLEAFYFKVPIIVNRYPVWVRDIEPKEFQVPVMDGFHA